MYIIPGQGSSVHVLLSVDMPKQLLPPCAGNGFEHSLQRVCMPVPQDTEQSVNTDHSPQLPCTFQEKKTQTVMKSKAFEYRIDR